MFFTNIAFIKINIKFKYFLIIFKFKLIIQIELLAINNAIYDSKKFYKILISYIIPLF